MFGLNAAVLVLSQHSQYLYCVLRSRSRFDCSYKRTARRSDEGYFQWNNPLKVSLLFNLFNVFYLELSERAEESSVDFVRSPLSVHMPVCVIANSYL